MDDLGKCPYCPRVEFDNRDKNVKSCKDKLACKDKQQASKKAKLVQPVCAP